MTVLNLAVHGRRAAVKVLGSAAVGLVLSAATLLPSGTSLAAGRATCTTVQCVITFGDTAITARTNALNVLQTKVNNQLAAGHISASQAGTLAGDISTNLSGLAALKSKLDAETTLQSARQDIHSIYYQYRIFAVVLPRDYHELWLDLLMYVDGRMRAAQPKIENAIDAVQRLPDKDGDKGKINAAYADYRNQLAAAEGQIDAAQGLIPALTPTAFNTALTTYRTDYTDYVNDIRTAHADLRSAAGDLHTIARALKDLVGSQSGALPVPTATAASTGA